MPHLPVLERSDTKSTASYKPGKIHLLQYLRAFAAISVVMHHSAQQLYLQRGYGLLLDIFHYRLGAFGVALFFAISGYLMALLTEKANPWRFLAHRVVRIYPIFWIITLAVIALALWDGLNFGIDPLALGLIPGGPHRYVLGTEWTLPYELVFYLFMFFIVLIGMKHKINFIAVSWFLSVSIINFLMPELLLDQGQWPTISYLMLSEKTLPFSAALLIPHAMRLRWVGPTTPVLAIGLLACSEVFPQLQAWFISLGCTCLVAAAASPEANASIRKNATLVALGDWSFALYLCHVPIINLLYRYAPATATPLVLWCGAVGAALIAATVLGRFDIFLYGYLKRGLDHSSGVINKIVVAVFLFAMLVVAPRLDVQQRTARQEENQLQMLGQQLQMVSADSISGLDVALHSLGFVKTPEGPAAIDRIMRDINGQLRLQGWVYDPVQSASRHAVMAFYAGHYLGQINVTDRRPDVSKYLELDREKDARVGFSGAVNLPSEPKCNEFLLLTVSLKRTYFWISKPVQIPGCG